MRAISNSDNKLRGTLLNLGQKPQDMLESQIELEWSLPTRNHEFFQKNVYQIVKPQIKTSSTSSDLSMNGDFANFHSPSEPTFKVRDHENVQGILQQEIPLTPDSNRSLNSGYSLTPSLTPSLIEDLTDECDLEI